ncbi:uncharacterized protein PHACADRAFT_214573 [Phanerochaete carnosa HHB-10118-sp]|uniref:Uncharacterized protein n=1 Tax=Phanerochaete carnosa (strain HHB-10118-sp) TaxID=650164 RepID=K5UHH3_PHACS|nr:uncharacterized protein PHACADRAFT_214573 [Phanerochaete carnosa HHB-10118-sp]EKM48951.1 hypothetical protein PHACADRAFT_214573 [Phanerochaete carnosa HHB-10118-sp]
MHLTYMLVDTNKGTCETFTRRIAVGFKAAVGDLNSAATRPRVSRSFLCRPRLFELGDHVWAQTY